jgi:crossover junction endodeoxyribonuclease RuvC
MKILGIDPGSARIGYGVVNEARQKFEYVDAGLLKIYSKDKNERLSDMGDSFLALLKKEKPDLVSMEKLFFCKNLKTAIEVSQARGVLTFIIIKSKIPLLEFTPSEVKSTITGYGNADKKAVARTVEKILKINKINGCDDVTDALAIAITAGYRKKRELVK